MALPPEDDGLADDVPSDEAAPGRPELRLIEASEARERRCADCGKTTATWRPVRRNGAPVILCAECAAKPQPEEGGCPQCGARLGPGDTFCGRCGARIEYECPRCGATLDPGDSFCGKCGTRLG